MSKKKDLTIDDLLNMLQNPSKPDLYLPNTKETWQRIWSRDKFSELGLESSELEKFLKEWKENNNYSNL